MEKQNIYNFFNGTIAGKNVSYRPNSCKQSLNVELTEKSQAKGNEYRFSPRSEKLHVFDRNLKMRQRQTVPGRQLLWDIVSRALKSKRNGNVQKCIEFIFQVV